MKVEPTTSVPELVTPVNKRRRDIRLKDLPKAVQEAFTKVFTPVVIEFSGCIEAWTSPSVAEIEELWESTMPDGIYDRFSEFNAGKVVEALVCSSTPFDLLLTSPEDTG